MCKHNNLHQVKSFINRPGEEGEILGAGVKLLSNFLRGEGFFRRWARWGALRKWGLVCCSGWLEVVCIK